MKKISFIPLTLPAIFFFGFAPGSDHILHDKCSETPALKFPDTVSGDFDGDGKKEYVDHKRKDKDPLCYCTIFFSNKKFPSIKDTGVFVTAIRNEGDLDDRPGDELLIIWASCEASEWMGGDVYSFREGKGWVALTGGISLYGVNETEDYVKKDPDHKGFILVTDDHMDTAGKFSVWTRSMKVDR